MYKLGNGNIIRLEDQAYIPLAEGNSDYQAYLAWVAEGNTPEAAEVITVPSPIITVSAWQIRKALNQLSLRDLVEGAIAQADQDTKDAWEYATEFERTHTLVINLGLALGKTEEELDSIFALAQSL